MTNNSPAPAASARSSQTGVLEHTEPKPEQGPIDHHTKPTSSMADEEKGAVSQEGTGDDAPTTSPGEVTGAKLVVITVAILTAFFLVALDRTIIGVAIPAITNEFSSINDISWYASSYLITVCATQLLWGKIFTYYPTKRLILISIVIFEVGSALCGAAPSSPAFIGGRALAGIGAAGIFSGATVVVTEIVPLRKRPMYIGLLGSVFGVSSIVGPLLGGAFTDHVSWRWCFYINLPLGGVSMLVLGLLLKPAEKEVECLSLTRQIIRLDPAGTIVFLPATICLLLALQWGGVEYPWNNGRMIALFIVAGVLYIVFVAIQIWRNDDATIPPRIIKQRSVAFATVSSILVGGALIAITIYLPLWFQAVKGTSAYRSGIDTIPLVLSLVVASIVSGAVTTKTGYYMPWLYAAVVLCAVGSGLMTTFDVNTSQPRWIGYQILFGFGLGCGMQKQSLAAQTVLSQKDVPIGVSLMFFTQTLGGSVIVSIAQSLFINDLADGLASIAGIDAQAILSGGATDLVHRVSPEKLPEVLGQYNDSLKLTFYVVVVCSCLLVLPNLGMEWKNIKKANPGAERK